MVLLGGGSCGSYPGADHQGWLGNPISTTVCRHLRSFGSFVYSRKHTLGIFHPRFTWFTSQISASSRGDCRRHVRCNLKASAPRRFGITPTNPHPGKDCAITSVLPSSFSGESHFPAILNCNSCSSAISMYGVSGL